MNKVLLVFGIVCLFFSCKSKKAIITKRSKSTTEGIVKNETARPSNKTYASATEKYIDTYKAVAQEEMRLYNIPASITLAQGILESGSGNGRLSVKANNHFGIKCHGWNGAKIYHDDDEDQECFRKYNNAKYSYRDHSLFLTTRRRYEKLFKLRKNDYKGWAKELRAAGYATDKKYPEKLIGLIERYKLYKFDDLKQKRSYENETDQGSSMKGEGSQKVNKEVISGSRVIPEKIIHVVVKGDTLYYISKMYNLTVQELKEINNLSGNNIAIGQQLQVNKN